MLTLTEKQVLLPKKNLKFDRRKNAKSARHACSARLFNQAAVANKK